ncbi:MAG TPA: ATP-binding protein [Verrucomicrobiae bacterium]|nr:ATP-binding protein [Verrucomicrobiae bacterium]
MRRLKFLKTFFLIILFGISSLLRAESQSLSAESFQQATNLLQLDQIAHENQDSFCVLHMECAVWWGDSESGRLILHDNSDTEQLEMDLPCAIPTAGRRLRLDGECVVLRTKEAIKVAGIPIVDNDGLHKAAAKSGAVFLTAGLHPIQVAWFNNTYEYTLEVSYKGPGIARQPVPNSVLFHQSSISPSEITNYLNGLNYCCYEGAVQDWSRLPSYDHLFPVKSGVIQNFDINVRTRDEHVCVQFSGYLKIQKSGLYTFYTVSDDGSRLFIDKPTLQVTVLNHDVLLPPLATALEAAPLGTEDYRWSQIDGVISFVGKSKYASEIEIQTAVGHMRLNVANHSNRPFTFVPKDHIHAVGVAHTIYDAEGNVFDGEIFVQSWDDIELRYITSDLWSIYPIVRIADIVGPNWSGDTNPVVHLRGRVEQTAKKGMPTLLANGADQLLLDGNATNCAIGQTVELLGQFKIAGTNRIFNYKLLRPIGESISRQNNLPILTTVAEAEQLNRSQLALGYPVRLRGIVTSVYNRADAFILQDSTRGIDVTFATWPDARIGDYFEIEGVTAAGDLFPYIIASSFKDLGPGSLPDPIRPNLDQLLNGSLQAQYVEIQGIVCSVETNRVTLLTSDGTINVFLNPFDPQLPPNCKNALVTLRGCLFNGWDPQTRELQVGAIYLDQYLFGVVQQAPADPFAMPAKSLDELLRFNPQASALERLKIFGQVVHTGDAGLYIMNDQRGVKVIPEEKVDIQNGDLVEVVGFSVLSGMSPVIQEALIRRTGHALLPPAHKIVSDDIIDGNYDSTLVQVSGILVGLIDTPGGTTLEMEHGNYRFTALIDDKNQLRTRPPIGSRLLLSGVYVGEGGNRPLGQPINSFQLLIDSPSSITLLARPSWWTISHLVAVIGALSAILVLSLFWINSLHKRVEERTYQLELQIEKRKLAEQQRIIEYERTRIARDLHDDLGAGLTEINVLGSLVKRPMTPDAERNGYLAKMVAVSRQLVASLDEIVWAINPQNDPISSLASYFSFYATNFMEQASITCALDISENLPDQPLDSKHRHSMFLAFKEALNNVVRHAKATDVWLRIKIEGNNLVVTVADNGCGFHLTTTNQGKDGLRSMDERMKALNGSCLIESSGGKGTRVELRLPLDLKL